MTQHDWNADFAQVGPRSLTIRPGPREGQIPIQLEGTLRRTQQRGLS